MNKPTIEIVVGDTYPCFFFFECVNPIMCIPTLLHILGIMEKLQGQFDEQEKEKKDLINEEVYALKSKNTKIQQSLLERTEQLKCLASKINSKEKKINALLHAVSSQKHS